MSDGPLDLVFVPSWVTNVEENWDEPLYARFLSRLASFSRLILFDKRGTGLSDRMLDHQTLEQRMDDVRAVMDAVGSERAAIFGSTEGGALCALFAAIYPERTAALVLYGAYAKRIRSRDYPWGPDLAERQAFYDQLLREWGGPALLDFLAPSMIGNEHFGEWWAGYLRRSASPGAALALTQLNSEIDIRSVLPAIRVPTLIVNRTGDRLCPPEGGRYLAQHIPDAHYVELPGEDHLPFVGGADSIVDAVQEFLTGMPPVEEPYRVLTTLLYVDIVGSTAVASEIGDRRWGDLLATYQAEVRRALLRYRGEERAASGDGLLASFDGPARAIHGAFAIVDAAHQVGIDVRCGLHTGECEVRDGELSGIALHIGSRIISLAAPGQVLVSSTVKDLVAGSGIEFRDAGRHTLRGVQGIWVLYAAERGSDRRMG